MCAVYWYRFVFLLSFSQGHRHCSRLAAHHEYADFPGYIYAHGATVGAPVSAEGISHPERHARVE